MFAAMQAEAERRLGQAKRAAPSGRPSPAKKQRPAPVSSDEELSDPDDSGEGIDDGEDIEVCHIEVYMTSPLCAQRRQQCQIAMGLTLLMQASPYVLSCLWYTTLNVPGTITQ